MKRIYALLVCFILGCAGNNPILYAPIMTNRVVSIYLDATFLPSEVTAIVHGVEQWNHFLNGNLTLKIEEGSLEMSPLLLSRIVGRGDYIFFSITAAQSSVADTVKYENGERKVYRTLAYCDEIGGHYVYFLTDRLSEINLTWVTMHEIGHLLGLSHQSRGLMYRYYLGNNYRCVDRHTTTILATLHRWDIDTLRGCQSDSREGQ